MADWIKTYKPERRIEWSDVARSIRDMVTVEEALSVYCPETHIRNRRCPCPIHRGKDYNFSFTDKGYTCFVCGSSGDVIDLVKAVCELATRQDAMRQINRDMRLSLPLAGEVATGKASEKLQMARAKAESKRKAIEAWNKRYNELYDEYAALIRRIKDENTDPYDRAAAEARLVTVNYLIDTLPEEPR